MQNRVEPPVLISRLMVFVLATASVVLTVLMMTLSKMFPLNRPQIFFLQTTIRDNQDVKLVEMPPESTNLDLYKQNFVREYVRYRNEIFTDNAAMQQKWNSKNSPMRLMSADDVYADFAQTAMFAGIMGELPGFEYNCPVIFDGAPLPLPLDIRNPILSKDIYQVKIRYFCSDNTGRSTPKDYTIKVRLVADEGTQIKWADRIENPLGMRVAEYNVSEGDGDPLNTGFLETE